MKLATFNINNVNKRLPNLLAWLPATSPGRKVISGNYRSSAFSC